MMVWLYAPLTFINLFLMPFLTIFPFVVIAVHGWRKHEMRHNILVLTPGPFLGIHLIWTACSVWSLFHPPPGYIVPDLHPFDQIIQFTMNWSIPFCLAGMILAVALGRKKIKKKYFLIGGIVFLATAVGFILYARYFFRDLLGDPLKDYVWWL